MNGCGRPTQRGLDTGKSILRVGYAACIRSLPDDVAKMDCAYRNGYRALQNRGRAVTAKPDLDAQKPLDTTDTCGTVWHC